MGHLATTYAAVMALCELGGEALDSIDRAGLRKFIMARRQSDGSFTMHHGGGFID